MATPDELMMSDILEERGLNYLAKHIRGDAVLPQWLVEVLRNGPSHSLNRHITNILGCYGTKQRGTGRTYSMVQEANRLIAEGQSVIVIARNASMLYGEQYRLDRRARIYSPASRTGQDYLERRRIDGYSGAVLVDHDAWDHRRAQPSSVRWFQCLCTTSPGAFYCDQCGMNARPVDDREEIPRVSVVGSSRNATVELEFTEPNQPSVNPTHPPK